MMRAVLLLLFAATGSLSCIDLEAPPPRNGYVSGRVLIGPGVGLSHATVVVEQVHLYDGKGTVLAEVASAPTDAQGYFEPIPIRDYSGLLRLRSRGGQFRDLVSQELIQLDASTEIRALYMVPLFGERTVLMTPVHSLIDARFRSRVREVNDTPQALEDAQRILDAHFGALAWEHVIPASLDSPAISPTDEVRAAFLLGGLSVLADDLRAESGSTPQAVHLFTLLDAAVEDLAADPHFEGNDGNDAAPGSGLQIGICPPVDPGCAAPPGGCQLGACRPRCDMYSNLVRGGLVAATRKFIGSRAFPSPWNASTLGAEDARAMLERLGGNTDPDLFGSACLETTDRVSPTLTWERPDEGAFVRGTITARVRALDDAEALPRVFFEGYPDDDGNPNNQIATATIDTRAVNGGTDGAVSLTAIARDAASNERRSTRTFHVDNTAPEVALNDAGFFLDGASGTWWIASATPTLRGTASDANLDHVEVLISGEVVATADVMAGQWSVTLPAGMYTPGGNEIVARALDRAGNATPTAPVLLRLDITPPGLLAEASPVHDEAFSSLDYPDDAPSNTWVQRHTVGGSPVDLAQSMPGACATVRKFSHLLFRQHVLGASGALNPLQTNWVVSDDGVGIEPGTTQLRVFIRNGSTTTEILPWTMVTGVPIAPQAVRYQLGLYRDGALALPALSTTEGEYHVELRAVDRLGRASQQERCWTHRILAPTLRPNGAPTGQMVMFPTSLQSGSFSAAFLNTNAAGDAMWMRRVKNYLGTPIYLQVSITQNADAQVSRRFVIRNALANRRGVSVVCGVNPCGIAQASQIEVTAAGRHADMKLRARVFLMNGSQLGAEILPCPGCTNDDDAQTYTFLLPARATPQGVPLAEYALMTHLRATLPAGGGTNVLMAPQDEGHPDSGPYGEFLFNGIQLTGRAEAPGSEVCTEQEEDTELGRWLCIERATRQTYRALTSVTYTMIDQLATSYREGATSTLLTGAPTIGKLDALSVWNTIEPAIP